MPSLQQIQLAIREYLNSNQTFENFSKEHIVTLENENLHQKNTIKYLDLQCRR